MAGEYIILQSIDELDNESRYLVHKAKDALESAYAPYSKYLVGAALLLENGTVVTGANNENVSSPAGMCAERVALYAAAAQHPGRKIVRLAVVARRKTGKDLQPATPCGPCRQVMLEFERRQRKTIGCVMMDRTHKWVVAPSAASLLPFPFTPDMISSPKGQDQSN